jgi:hypothetical protein
MRRALAAVAALALAAGVSVGCGASPEAPPAEPPGGIVASIVEGIDVSLVQLRGDVASRQAQVQIVNGSDESVTIGDVIVVDPRFDGEAGRVVEGRASDVVAGGRVDIRVQLPAVACGASSAGEPTVHLELTVGAHSEVVTLAADDPLGFVGPLHERECRAKRLAAAAALSFTGFEPSSPGEPATLRLRVDPADGGAAGGGAAEEVVIAAVQPTNLLSFDADTADGAYPLDLVVRGSGEAVDVDLPLVPSRCDPHAVQEDKRGTIFDVRVIVDDEPGEIELFVGDALRGRILTWVAHWCGFGSG